MAGRRGKRSKSVDESVQRKVERELDAAIEDSFPCSDPVSFLQPLPVREHDRELCTVKANRRAPRHRAADGSEKPRPASRKRRQNAAVLDLACKKLLLRPRDEMTRQVVASVMSSARLTPAARDSPLVRGLIDEARTQGDDLAFRLEQRGCDAIFVSAVAAKLCQTLAALRQHIGA